MVEVIEFVVVFVVLVQVRVIVAVVLLMVIVVVVRLEPRRLPCGHRGRCGCLCYRCSSCGHNVQKRNNFDDVKIVTVIPR